MDDKGNGTTWFMCLVVGIIIGSSGALLGVAIRNEGQDINSRLSALETANEKNVDDIKTAEIWGSQAIENSIKAHRRIDSIELQVAKLEGDELEGSGE